MSGVALRQYLQEALSSGQIDTDFALDRWLDSERLSDEWAATQLELMLISERLPPPEGPD